MKKFIFLSFLCFVQTYGMNATQIQQRRVDGIIRIKPVAEQYSGIYQYGALNPMRYFSFLRMRPTVMTASDKDKIIIKQETMDEPYLKTQISENCRMYTDLLQRAITTAAEIQKNLERIPSDDEELLFLLKSLLALKEDTDTVLPCVEDALSLYDSYYDPDPYFTSLERLQKIGPYDCKSLFNEKTFNDIALVLFFSKAVDSGSSGVAETVVMWTNALKAIVETTRETPENKALLEQFKQLQTRLEN